MIIVTAVGAMATCASSFWPNMSKATKARFVFALLAGVSCPAVMTVLSARAGSSAGAIFPAYRQLSKAWIGFLAQVMSVAPIALWDIAYVVLALLFVVALVRRIRRRLPISGVISWACCVASLTLALAVWGWALNHYAPPLSQDLNLEVKSYSVDELAEATEAYLHDAATLAPRVPRNKNYALERQDFFELARIAGASYEPLAQEYAVFQGCGVPVKALTLFGEPLLYSGHTGIFWAPTGESGVPLNCPAADLPFVMCHEAAHRLAIADEGEANFCAYLACDASSDVRLQYAGAYNAFVYCFNALYAADSERAADLVNSLEGTDIWDGVRLVFTDRQNTHEQYAAYEGEFKRVGTAVNDNYLKSFGNPEGVRSYGTVVDYLIAWNQAP